MHVRRSVTISCVKEETVWADSQYRWHLSALRITLFIAIQLQKKNSSTLLDRLFRFQEVVLRYLLENSELALQTDIAKVYRGTS